MIEYLINGYTREGGVRRLKELLTDVIREINLDELCGKVTLRDAKRRRCGGRDAGTAKRRGRVLEVTIDAVRQRYLPFREEYLH